MSLQVLLVNGWSDDNKGDCAIVEGLIHLITAEYPGADIGIVSSFALSDGEKRLHYRFSSGSASRVAVYGALLPASRLQSQVRPPILRRLSALLIATVLWCIAPVAVSARVVRLLPKRVSELLVRYRDSDIIVSKGGHIFVSDGSLGGLLGLYLYLFPILLAIRLRKRVVIYGQSIGPVPDRVGQAFLGAVLRRCASILTREELSLEFVRSIAKQPKNEPRLCWDTAFAVEREILPGAVLAQLPAQFVVMTVRQWRFPGLSVQAGRERYHSYLQVMADTIDNLWTDHGLHVVLAPQVIGPSSLEDDCVAWNDLASFVANKDALLRVDADLSPGQLMDLYARARVLVGTRFHSVILGLAAGTPAIAVSYHGFKTRGIMRMMGLEALVLDIDAITHRDMARAVEDVLVRESEYRNLLAIQMPAILDDSARTLRAILDGRAPRGVRSAALKNATCS